MKFMRMNITKLAVLTPQSLHYIYYLRMLLLASPPLWLHKHTDLRAKDFQPPDLWHQQKLAKFTCAWSWKLCEINASVPKPGLKVHSTTERQQHSFVGWNFEGIPSSGSAWVEYILYLAVLQIWTEFLCPWNI